MSINLFVIEMGRCLNFVLRQLIPNLVGRIYKKRALRSRSLRDGPLTKKDRFAVFIRSFDSFNIRLKTAKSDYPI